MAPSGWWRVVAVTYEQDGARWIPVVKHEMYGPTQERAIEVYQAHMRSDGFLRACSLTPGGGAYQGTPCRTEAHLERIP